MKKISYFTKYEIECPLCKHKFKKEELLTGSSRLIAGELKVDLKRDYIKNEKYGNIYPRIYSITVCPNCYLAAFPNEFNTIIFVNNKIKKLLISSINKRKEIKSIFEDYLNFDVPRRLQEGAASYILAMMCYEHLDKNHNPTLNQAKCAIRSAWIFEDLDKENPNQNYNYLQKIFYYKAAYLYKLTIEKEQDNSEPINAETIFGPDTDKNYGYDSVLYLSSLLEYFYGNKEDKQYRYNQLIEIKTLLSKIAGMGKSSKEKPSILLDKIKEVYFKISNEIKTLK
ncbi:hypothetical protein BmHG_00014 [Borrelia miyamotoi]|uniref:DUF2225 domain-containing protein n=1 Tax=Borrelia miyamotoi TaxID=47466 RepID=A0AAP8YS63_9SPIR|nr:DUF2225 domain-containing protein [Borrelia miyamotoi]AHH05405.1 Hypothetical protein BOM_0862 [Borrelia miyamotoi FR64b]ATQ15162.1 DUF2225 domain-containing protein [Borrelia miyamotoi]ATQ16344.1 DUF2225 domain-containing protein [Borrelia miyamotoi]ATQ17487.1 DUF2225 domain-containing protein [Borrelia miyamotoi]ATQ18010.1 DUF2225 domain-containing protein [Borrelia miyamotoi]